MGAAGRVCEREDWWGGLGEEDEGVESRGISEEVVAGENC